MSKLNSSALVGLIVCTASLASAQTVDSLQRNQTGDPDDLSVPDSSMFFSLSSEGPKLTGTVAVSLADAHALAFTVAVEDTDQNGRVDLFDVENGPASGLRVTASYTWVLGLTHLSDEAFQNQLEGWCASAGVVDPCSTGRLEAMLDSCESAICDDVRREYEQSEFSRGLAPWLLRFDVGATYRSLSYRDAEADYARESDSVWLPQLKLGLVRFINNSRATIGGSIEFAEKGKNPGTVALCEDVDTAMPFTCDDGIFTSGIQRTSTLTTQLEWRQFINLRFGTSIRATWVASDGLDDSATTFDESGFRSRNITISTGFFMMFEQLRLSVQPGLRIWTYDREPEPAMDIVGSIGLGGTFGII